MSGKVTVLVEDDVIELAKQYPERYVELELALDNVRTVGMNPSDCIATVNGTYEIYVLEPSPPGPDAIILKNGNDITLVEILSTKGNSFDNYRKKAVAVNASKSIGIIPYNIDIH